MIVATDVSYRYGSREVLSRVGIETDPATLTCVIGPNGSGKSTLLKCLYSMLKPYGGTVLINGTSIDDWTVQQVATQVAVVPQDRASSMGLSVAESVLLGRNPHLKDHQGYSANDKALAAEALKQVGIYHLASRRLGELSGGERQRVGIARCLAQGTEILLLDEPTNHLDIRYQHEVLALIRSLQLATIVVLHDLNLAGKYCDKVVLIDEGKISATGDTDEVLTPEILEPVYGIDMRRIEVDGLPHLIFGSQFHGRHDRTQNPSTAS